MPNSQEKYFRFCIELIKNLTRSGITALVDVAVNWPTYYAAALLEASEQGKLPKSAPEIYRQALESKKPLRTFAACLRENPKRITDLYSRSGQFLKTAYLPLLLVERAIHDGLPNTFSDTHKTILAALVGGAVGATGQTAILQGRNFWGTRPYGLAACVAREGAFVSAAISTTPERFAAYCVGKKEGVPPSLEFQFLSTAVRSLLLLGSQPPARLGAFMQAHKVRSNPEAIKTIWRNAKKAAKPKDGIWRHAFFPGGAWRTFSLIGTAAVYTGMRNVYDYVPLLAH